MLVSGLLPAAVKNTMIKSGLGRKGLTWLTSYYCPPGKSQAGAWRQGLKSRSPERTSWLATQGCSAMYNPEPLARRWHHAQPAGSTT